MPDRVHVVVCAADHGVTAKGVSAYPQAVSVEMVRNMLNGGAAISVLCEHAGYELTVVNCGLAHEFASHAENYLDVAIAGGTRDFSEAKAMSAEDANKAIQTGIKLAAQLAPYDLLIPGEMGIGNTTTASAIIAAITEQPARLVTGYGTGITELQQQRKVAVIEEALQRHAPAAENTLEKVGGFEVGVMAGLMIGAAAQRGPILLDGLIAAAAALIAIQYAPNTKSYFIAGHKSQEPGHSIALKHIGLEPLLDLDLRLGEGSGAVLAVPLLRAAMVTLDKMATFEEARISQQS